MNIEAKEVLYVNNEKGVYCRFMAVIFDSKPI